MTDSNEPYTPARRPISEMPGFVIVRRCSDCHRWKPPWSFTYFGAYPCKACGAIRLYGVRRYTNDFWESGEWIAQQASAWLHWRETHAAESDRE